MKSRNAEAQKLKVSVSNLNEHLQALSEEHDRYALPAELGAGWFECFPIETLTESLAADNNLPREKYCLDDMHHKYKIKRALDEKRQELEDKNLELRAADIDSLLEKIKSI